MLSPEQLTAYQTEGYLVIQNFATREEVDDLKARAEKLVEGFNPASTTSVFSTRNQKKTTDTYFLDSANNVSFFFEEKAFNAAGELQQDKSRSINKIGHALHDLDPVFRSFSRSAKVASLLQDLDYLQPVPVQSMYIFKQPGIGGEVVPHQDSTFLYTEPESVVGLWLALEDATTTNGCLWALPGSQKDSLARRMTLKEDRSITFDNEPGTYNMDAFVPVEVKSGSLVVLHGRLVHYSKENTSPVSRQAYSVHVVEGKPGVTWAADNWLQRQAGFPFEPLSANVDQVIAAT